MSGLIPNQDSANTQKEFRDEVQGMIVRYRLALEKLEADEKDLPRAVCLTMTYQRESIQDYERLLAKLQGLLDNLDRTILSQAEASNGGI
jgi:hypothetical protein